MKFPPDNKIKYGQDFSQHRGVPSDVEFEVKKFSQEGMYVLTGYGYGQRLEPYDKNSYGNGSLYVWGLTDEEREWFGEPPRNKFSLLDIE